MRCFVAAWPDELTRAALAVPVDDVRHRTAHRRATRVDDLHLTLAFIGNLADDAAFAAADAVGKLRFKPFEWQMDTLGFFEQAGVVWAGSENACTPLIRLADRVRGALDQLNIEYDRRPLAPHVTLLHGVKNFDAERIAPLRWRIDAIALHRSTGNRAGARYSRVTR